ncbi:MAG: photosynthetic complex assembly protein PuhC [bacterium]
MADLTSERPFPRGVLLGAAVLLGFSVLSAGAARITGIGTTTSLASTPVEARTLRFEDRPDGRVVVLEETAGGQRPVDVLAPGTNGFIRSVLRGLARERMLRGIGSEPAFRLTRWTDGRLSLEDSATGRRIELDAFGPTNVAAFGRLLYVSRQGSPEQGSPRAAARWEEAR